MSRRDQEREQRERERERESRRAPTTRNNEYFLPKDGIHREVITADICRYLGNNALVRPARQENPETRTVQEGYLISAYRNLTNEMIADLKADSARWEIEIRNATRGQSYASAHPSYRSSQIHHARQELGPSETAQGVVPGYPQPGPSGNVYDDGQYQNQQYTQAASGYMAPQQDYAQQQANTSTYFHGGNFGTEPSSSRRAPASQQPSASIPRDPYASTTPTYVQPDPRYAGYAQPAVASNQYAQQLPPQQPTDTGYGRVAGPQYDSSSYNPYDYSTDGASRAYQDNSYSQPMQSAPSTTIPAEPQRRPREREDRNSRHHRSDNRR